MVGFSSLAEAFVQEKTVLMAIAAVKAKKTFFMTMILQVIKRIEYDSKLLNLPA